ncbi:MULTISPECIES: PIN domain-containing protein [Rhizobium]|jgi:predicted nucleic-acid-binding protein|uniref:PIN domain-containing protein n=1 Tax=Rhizobium TaxID=379 RepID=UPI000675D3A5|nr:MULTISPECIES: PIN domain-containing protein [Rhizobium]KZS51968.1 hypothetical protein AS890_09845 [Rhizobium anhuiense bv. trifolii]MBB3300321.1 putative nucleic-acid-binding protein [Rhizobium sp. BK112]MBB3369964.1 putative nucleic-acid-binding protein [Rhizobium sp. BK077]MBB3746260.1 putative nucleic-acid-binding protein [Rhizobium sp. BK591]MBB4115259.1 putative nucleic-acid-binding protein [Rhizobium sp. BK226]
MIAYGVDTNVLLRLIVDDDPEQRAAALKFGEGIGRDYRGFLSLLNLLELDWALRARFGFKKKDVVEAIGKLTRVRGLDIENQTLVIKALRAVETRNADFADALIGYRAADEGCQATKTFDRHAFKTVPGMELLT